MKNIENFLFKKINKHKNLIIVITPKNDKGVYFQQKDIQLNLVKIINRDKYPVIYLDAEKYIKEILIHYDGKVNKFPFILKYKNGELVEAFNKIIKDLDKK